jgi:hypothetical protein
MTSYQLNQTAQEMVDYWSTTREIPFKGQLISKDDDGKICMCAQGQVLFNNGYTEEQLFDMSVGQADEETARILGISVSHSLFLRNINDNFEGSPQEVLSNPEKYLGPNWEKVLEFWWYIDTLSVEECDKIGNSYWTLENKILESAKSSVYDAATEVVVFGVADDTRPDTYDVISTWVFNYATLELIANMDNKFFYDLIMNP